MSLAQLKNAMRVKPTSKPRPKAEKPLQVTYSFSTNNESTPVAPVAGPVAGPAGPTIDRAAIMQRMKEAGIIRVVTKDDAKRGSESNIARKISSTNQRSSVEKLRKKGTNMSEDKADKSGKTDGADGAVGVRGLPVALPVRLEQDEGEGMDVTQKKARRTAAPLGKGVTEIPVEEWVDVRGESLIKKIPAPLPTSTMRVSGYYMNNRKKFVNFINSQFGEYRDDLLNENLTMSCDDMGKDNNADFKLLIHQKIVRDYLNLYTPYRGLLLYHGLGSGKTCSSIAIAEGIKSSKKVIIMTPASLRRNYMEEIKKCGDKIFKKTQHWEWVPLKEAKEAMDTLSSALGVSAAYIKKKKGVWLVDQAKPSNHDSLTGQQITSLDLQLDEMIQTKYQFINYNGLTRDKLRSMTNDYKVNIFDHSVVVIDEVHNFISRISNKLGKGNDAKGVSHNSDGAVDTFPIALALVLYEMLMNAQDMRIVFLTGTPIINYPNELGIMYNILRGYIKTWKFTLQPKAGSEGHGAISAKLKQLFTNDKYMDYFEYSKSNILSVTRNPFGFEKNIEKGEYRGVTAATKKGKESDQDSEWVFDERGQLSDTDFKNRVVHILETNGLSVNNSKTDVEMFKALPDKLDEFEAMFLGENNTIKNADLFKKRILGLSSYFRSAQEELLPRYDPLTDFEVVKIPMSDYQLGIYETARSAERKEDTKKKSKKPTVDKNGLFVEPTSSYRIFSRLYCNFVMPLPPGRPLPRENKMDESYTKALDETNKKGSNDLTETDAVEIEGDEIIGKNADTSYQTRISDALQYLRDHGGDVFSADALATYSPKFAHMLDNISDPSHPGLHLVYSQFRTLEGIGIFKMVLDYNGYTQFKIKKGADGVWDLNIAEDDQGKRTYALYTGTESSEEKEMIRNIYNSDWDPNLPITAKLKEIANDNHLGEIINILMITASGSEGINLRSTRFVHIMEPYWHPTRKDQVIGRARRICSHKSLPPEMQDVKVFMYLMTITDEQIANKISKELKMRDLSKLKYPVTGPVTGPDDVDNMAYRLVTSDEALYEISTMKEKIVMGLTKLIKESAIDCATYSRRGNSEQLECVQYGDPRVTEMSYHPDIKKQSSDAFEKNNNAEFNWRGREYEVRGKKYVHRKMSDKLAYIYDWESYHQALENPKIEPQLMYTEELVNGKLIRKNIA